jgi:Asp-tRNA(Asn)/Glu-tRNA(Gln) amidotransferase A subunit family amidase
MCHSGVRDIRSGTVSSRELIELTFGRIKTYNPTINGLIALREEEALRREDDWQ